MFDFFTHMHNKKHTQVGILSSAVATITLILFQLLYSHLHYKAESETFSYGQEPKSEEPRDTSKGDTIPRAQSRGSA
jgi:hypothetical protein